MKDYKALRSPKDTMEYVIEDVFEAGYKQGYEDGKADTPFTDTEEAEEKAYNRGLADMLEAVKSMRMMTADDLEEVFGLRFIGDIFVNLSPSKIASKYHAFKAQIKELEDAEIKVGDEIVYNDAHVVITYISPSNEWNGFLLNDCKNGKRGNGYTLMKGFKSWKKTGRHFPQIAEVLAELRGAENDE